MFIVYNTTKHTAVHELVESVVGVGHELRIVNVAVRVQTVGWGQFLEDLEHLKDSTSNGVFLIIDTSDILQSSVSLQEVLKAKHLSYLFVSGFGKITDSYIHNPPPTMDVKVDLPSSRAQRYRAYIASKQEFFGFAHHITFADFCVFTSEDIRELWPDLIETYPGI